MSKYSIAYLPFPPSVNTTHRAVKGRVIKSKRYRDWINEAGQELLAQRVKGIPGKVYVKIELTAPDKRRRDADNTLKAVLDLLVKHQIIEDDNNTILIELSIRWCKSGHPCTVHIMSREENTD